MNPSEDKAAGTSSQAPGPRDPGNSETGLPRLRTWSGIYLLVFGCFVLWVALLAALTVFFS